LNEKYKQNFLRAGSIAKEVRAYGKSLIKPGASYNDVIAKINHKIVEMGARAAFPPQIALDDVAAHFIPDPGQEIIFSEQVIKLDIGVCYEGAIGDCAVSIDLSGKHQDLIDAAEAALLAAEKIVKVGLPVREIGRAIETAIASYGLKPIKNLCGHGLGLYKIHTSPSIPNYEDQSTAIIKPGMTFAIEPFATNGKGLIYEAGSPNIFSLISLRPVRSEIARALLTKIKAFQGLPFATHDLVTKQYPLMEVRFAIAELITAGVIAGYAPLIEQGRGLVAQAENSILVDKEGKVFVTTR
jgi:methionyl aminopeptidase